MRSVLLATAAVSALSLTACSGLVPRASTAEARANASIDASNSATAAAVTEINASAAKRLPVLHLPRVGKVWIIGDTLSQGDDTTDPSTDNFAVQVASELNWTLAFQFAAGFGKSAGKNAENAATTIATATLPDPLPALVIIQEGRSDGNVSPTDEQRGIVAAITAVRSRLPHTPLVLVGPAIPTAGDSATYDGIDTTLATEAARFRVPLVSPIVESWVTGSNLAVIVHNGTAGTTFFSDAGQAYMAARLVADLHVLCSFG